MTDLETIFRALDELEPDELAQVQAYIGERMSDQKMPPGDDAEARLAALDAALEEFREGLTEEQLDELIWAMNVEYIDPDMLKKYDWLDDSSEDEG